MKMKFYSLLLCLAVLCCLPVQAQKEYFAPPKRTVQAVRTETPPTIDGKLDEPEWNNAKVMTDFVNTRLDILSEDQSKVRMLYDDTYLYFAIEVEEKEEDIIANIFKYDRIQLRFEDYFQIGLDTFHDGKQAYLFLFSPIGTRWDSREGVFGRNPSWDANWEVKTVITKERWFAEVRIPIGIMHLNREDDQTWGINFRHRYSITNNSHHWNYNPNSSMDRRASGPKFISDFGILENLDLANLKVQADAKIETYVSSNTEHAEGHNSLSLLSTGLDVELRISSHWTTQFTLNPDFGEIAADEGDVQNRDTARFLSERRTFFNEGAELFRTPINIYDSRQITDIDTAAKVTGTGEGWTMASLVLRGEGKRSGEDSSFLVSRYTQEATDKIQLGATLIAVDREIGENAVFGIDSRVAFSPSTIWTTQILQMNGSNSIDGISEVTESVSAHAFETELEWGTQPWSFELEFKKITSEFLPDLAFISRRDIIGPSFEIGFSDSYSHDVIEGVFVMAQTEHYVDHDHHTVLRDYSIFGGLSFQNDWDINMSYRDDYHIPFHNTSQSIGATYNRQDRFKSWRMNYSNGIFQDNTFDQYEVTKPFKLSPRWTNDLTSLLRTEKRDEGDRDVWLWRNESEYTFNWEGRIKLTLEATSDRAYKRTLLFAYEEVKDWDFFVVLNDFRDDDARGEQIVRSFFLKLIYHW